MLIHFNVNLLCRREQEHGPVALPRKQTSGLQRAIELPVLLNQMFYW